MKELLWVGTIVGLAGYFLYLIDSAALVACFAWMFFLTALLFLGYVWASGRRARYTRNSRYARENIQTHKDHITVLSLLILLGVVALIIALRKHGGTTQLPELYWIHMVFVGGAMFFFSLARFVFTGVTSPVSHRTHVHRFMVFYAIAFFTGTILLNNRFQIFG